ncbi:MAG: TetR/AcrR family transcriptional regulator [Planctomycetota bacterium]
MVQTGSEDAAGRQLTRRREILRAASKCFREKGFHPTGMRDVAASLGMTVGNLYYYFRNKGEILRFCQLHTLGRLERLARWVASLDAPADEKLFRVVVEHVVCLNEGTGGSLAHLEIPEKSSPENRDLIERRRAYERALEEIVEEAGSAPGPSAGEPSLAVMALLGASQLDRELVQPSPERAARATSARPSPNTSSADSSRTAPFQAAGRRRRRASPRSSDEDEGDA